MKPIARFSLKAISPVNPEIVCKEALLRLVIKARDCKASGRTDCLVEATINAKKHLEQAFKMDSSAFAFSKCKELASIAEIDPSSYN